MMYEIGPFVYNKPDSETSERFRFFSGMISESFLNHSGILFGDGQLFVLSSKIFKKNKS